MRWHCVRAADSMCFAQTAALWLGTQRRWDCKRVTGSFSNIGTECSCPDWLTDCLIA